MDENKEIEIDFKKIFEMIKQKLVYIILITVIGAVASGCITNFFITPQYTASIQLYAWSNGEHIVTPSSNITPNEIEASQMLINSYLVAIQSDTFIEKVADQVEGNITPTQIKKMLSCSAIEETNIFKVSITSTDPKQAAEIANVIADVCPDEIVRIMKVGGVEIVDYAKKTSKELRISAMEYAEDVLSSAQERLRELKNVVYDESMKTDQYFGDTLSVLSENIQELRLGR
mgnify:CR=1 FL=1